MKNNQIKLSFFEKYFCKNRFVASRRDGIYQIDRYEFKLRLIGITLFYYDVWSVFITDVALVKVWKK